MTNSLFDTNPTAATTGTPAVPLTRPTAVVWIGKGQGPLAKAIIERAGLAPAAIAAAPEATADLEGLPEAPPFDDLRQALVETEAQVALLLAPPINADDANSDDAILDLACRDGRLLLTLDPSPTTLLATGKALREARLGRAFLIPTLRRQRLFDDLLELLPNIGAIRSAWCALRSPSLAGGLGGRLVDGMGALTKLLGTPDRIDAEFAPLPGPSPTPSDLSCSTGTITANLRFPGLAKNGSLAATNAAGPWGRTLTVVGETGTLTLTDASLTLTDPAGNELDFTGSTTPPDSATVIAEQVRRVIDRKGYGIDPAEQLPVLACAEAALLSARTGNPEHPETLLRAAGVR
jgi:hypothetical protein